VRPFAGYRRLLAAARAEVLGEINDSERGQSRARPDKAGRKAEQKFFFVFFF
jgi:hypothetical protein